MKSFSLEFKENPTSFSTLNISLSVRTFVEEEVRALILY